jgi:hypothetical protein
MPNRNGDGVAVPSNNQVVVSTSVQIKIGDGNDVGFAQSITRNDTRRVDRIRHLSAVDAGRIMEQAPGPEDYTLRITGFAVYSDADILATNPGEKATGSFLNQLLGAAGPQQVGNLSHTIFRSMQSQIVPFDVVEERRRPGNDDPNSFGRTIYADCWMTSYSSPIQIGQITIAEDVSCQPTYIG